MTDRKDPTKKLTKKPHRLFKGPFVRVAKKIHEIQHSGALIYFEARVLGAVEQLTWGWNKKSDRIAYSQIEERSGLSHSNAVLGIQNLEAKGIIRVIRTRHPDGRNDPNSVKIQPDHHRWRLDRVSDQYRNHLAKKRSRYHLSIANKRRSAEIENDAKALKITKASAGGSPTKNRISSETSPHQAITDGGGSPTKTLSRTHPIQGKKKREEESRSLVENAPLKEPECKPFSSPSPEDQKPETDPLILDLESILPSSNGSAKRIADKYGPEICRFAIHYVIDAGLPCGKMADALKDTLSRFADPSDEWGRQRVSEYRTALKEMVLGIMEKDGGLSEREARQKAMDYYSLGGKLSAERQDD